MSYRTQTRIGANEPVSAAFRNAASALTGIFTEFGVDIHHVQFERISDQEVRCNAAELPGQITLTLALDGVTLSIPNTTRVLL